MKKHLTAILVVLAAFVLIGAGCLAQSVRGTLTRTIKVGALSRTYYLHRPPGLPKNKSAALVLVFHGGGGTALQIERHSGFSELADREGFLVAYPEGVGRSWNDGRDAAGIAAQRDRVDDLGFMAALVDDVARVHPLDPKRVYAAGISNGGIFSHALGARLSTRIAAIAPVAGGLAEPYSFSFQPEQPCRC
ncbi:alpha/beta hydrolase family esterase [Cyanobium sp. ATX 6F1]|uniref:alpha/beta hydrolase family esterase n=1 Tax=unclassified Cyanobium TaxID=2627006 RepID=UPI0020CED015|nr:PHB depolymerase family esterase [Cyanobium sp. ATX 6F1]MCP9915872.1 hypothetical protein [Cyanobium sp. ATX 6F1]